MIILLQKHSRVIFLDLSVFIALYLLPSIAHILPLPIYLLEPMRICVFAGYLLSKSTYNAVFLAVTIPIFSFLTTGHPLFYKAVLISLELSANIVIFIFLYRKWHIHGLFSIVVSIILSKLLYYAFKYVLIQYGFISGSLVSTGIVNQIIAMIILSVVFYVLFSLFYKRNAG